MKIAATIERWPIARPFTIARGSKTVAEVVVATIKDDGIEARGECVPYARYGHSSTDTAAQIEGFRGPFDREALRRALPAGPARNAIDCALWDLAAQRAGQPAWQLAGVSQPVNVATAYTLSLDSPAAMAARATAERERPLLKLKLGTDPVADIERLLAVRTHAPAARLIVDANEGWDFGALEAFMPAAVNAGVELIEQPLAQDADHALLDYRSPVPLAADESFRDGTDLAEVAQRYQAVNIKLDKTGGLTAALDLARQAQAFDLDIMVGCMVATSLAIAPALLLAGFARVVDLDGALLLARDRSPGLAYEGGKVSLTPAVWGTGSTRRRPAPM